jgi:glycerophosphoryl diester phosphodiesterase
VDLQETRDHQFVVMHDTNLESLCGVDCKVSELTLAELTSLTARENGHSAPVAGFDEYLETADQLHQKLLIEIKTHATDSEDLAEDFVSRYSQDIKAHGHQVQSLDARLIRKLETLDPDLYTCCIITWNLVYPVMECDAFAIEATSLNDSFLALAAAHGQQVYAWTANEEDQMNQLMFMGVSGIITDEPSLLHDLEDIYLNEPDYAARLLLYTSLRHTNGSEIFAGM